MRQLKITQQITSRDINSVNLYLQEVSKYDMVTAEEEVELSVKIRNGDVNALRKLVVANLRFVISVAKQYQNQGLSLADLINEGNVGLVKAAQKFDETRGFKFISYAVWWIRQSIIQALSEQTRTVRLPLNRLSTMQQISKATSFLEQKLEREPYSNEVADYLGLKQELVTDNNKIKNRQVSFDMPLSSDGGSEMCLGDLFESEQIASPDSNLISESLSINIARAIEKLSRREAEVICMYYGLNNYSVHSQQEIALLLDLSNERVRQIRNTVLIKLKRMISGNNSFYNNL